MVPCYRYSLFIAAQYCVIITVHTSLYRLLGHTNYDILKERMNYYCNNVHYSLLQGDYDKAQSCLEKAIEEHYPDRDRLKQEQGQISSERRACAQVCRLAKKALGLFHLTQLGLALFPRLPRGNLRCLFTSQGIIFIHTT